jgi:hypothetical protein
MRRRAILKHKAVHRLITVTAIAIESVLIFMFAVHLAAAIVSFKHRLLIRYRYATIVKLRFATIVMILGFVI